MSNKPNFIGTLRSNRYKFILFSFTFVFICIVAGLLFQNPGAQFIFSVRAAPRAIPAEDLSIVGQPSLLLQLLMQYLSALVAPWLVQAR
jgi:hypothetical protein